MLWELISPLVQLSIPNLEVKLKGLNKFSKTCLELGYCNSPVFTKIKKNCFRCELSDCLICLRCLHPRFIDRRLLSPLLSRTGRRPTFATLTLDLCDTGFHPITVAKTARDQPKPTERKTPLIIKRDIFIARRKVFS